MYTPRCDHQHCDIPVSPAVLFYFATASLTLSSCNCFGVVVALVGKAPFAAGRGKSFGRMQRFVLRLRVL
jgi:hypothetical protein